MGAILVLGGGWASWWLLVSDNHLFLVSCLTSTSCGFFWCYASVFCAF